MIDWNKPIETVPCERNPVPVPCEFVGKIDGAVEFFIRGDWFDERGNNFVDHSNEDCPWTYCEEDAGIYIPQIRNVELPEETATWRAKRWWQSATDAEKYAMRALVGSE